MFEAQTYENVLADVLSRAPEGIDLRQGSIFFDAVSGICFKIAKYYADLEQVFNMVFLPTAVGDYLTTLGEQYAVYRRDASPAKYKASFEGAMPEPGTRFFADGHYFTLVDDSENGLYLEAEESGIGANDIPPGTPVVPVDNVPGLTSASISSSLEPGTDEEEDESLRQRIQEKLAGPAENGNVQHYKTWCESITGVGRARIIPLWNGENTVKAVLIDTEGKPASAEVVERVQEYVDPGGTGLGYGQANIGAHFTAVAATPVTVTVSFGVVLSRGGSIPEVKAAAEKALADYFKDANLNTPESEAITLRVNAVGNILYSLSGVLDYTDLKFNGKASNIELETEEVLSLGEVTVSAADSLS